MFKVSILPKFYSTCRNIIHLVSSQLPKGEEIRDKSKTLLYYVVPTIGLSSVAKRIKRERDGMQFLLVNPEGQSKKGLYYFIDETKLIKVKHSGILAGRLSKRGVFDITISSSEVDEDGLKKMFRDIIKRNLLRKRAKDVKKEREAWKWFGMLEENGISINKIHSFSEASILMAGGTIDMSAGPGKKTSEATADLIKKAGKKVGAEIKIFQDPPDSTNVGPEEWKEILAAISEEIKRKESLWKEFSSFSKALNLLRPGGIVITHGTDTLTETALIVSLYFRNALPFPIALTGSALAPKEKGSDAYQNISGSIELALNPLSPLLSFIVIGSDIHLASRAEKINTVFWGPEKPDLGRKAYSYIRSLGKIPGRIRGSSIQFSPSFIREGISVEELKLNQSKVPKELCFGYVERLYVNEYTPLDVFRDAIDRLKEMKKNGDQRVYGLVIEGRIPSDSEIKNIFNKAQEILIFIQPQPPGSGDLENFFLPKGLSSAKARTKLSFLGAYFSSNEIPQIMKQNIVGEIEPATDLDRIRDPLGDYSHDTEFIVAFPGMSYTIINDAIRRLLERRRGNIKELNLVIEGFGDGHLPVGNESILSRVLRSLEGYYPDLGERLKRKIKSKKKQIKDVKLEEAIELIANQLRDLSSDEQYKEAREMIKKALMDSNKILEALGMATENGIRVIMTTNARHAFADISAYEVGEMLKGVGAENMEYQSPLGIIE